MLRQDLDWVSAGISGKRAAPSPTNEPNRTLRCHIGIRVTQDLELANITECKPSLEVTECNCRVCGSNARRVLVQHHWATKKSPQSIRPVGSSQSRLEQRPSSRIRNTQKSSTSGRVHRPRAVAEVSGINTVVQSQQVRIDNSSRRRRGCTRRCTSEIAGEVASTLRDVLGESTIQPLAERFRNELVQIKITVCKFFKGHKNDASRVLVNAAIRSRKQRVRFTRCRIFTPGRNGVTSVIDEANLHRCARLGLTLVDDVYHTTVCKLGLRKDGAKRRCN